MAQRKLVKEVVVKTSLPGHLREPTLLPTLERWILHASKTMHRGSLVFNRLLLHCLDNGEPLPDLHDQSLYIQCFKVGIRNDFRKTTGPIRAVWDSYFRHFPVDEPITGDSQMYAYTANRTYKTAFFNSLQYCFKARQAAYIRQWVKQQGLPENSWHAVRCAINGWECTDTPPESTGAFVAAQRALLDPPPTGISFDWIQKNPNTVVLYFWTILRYLEQFPDSKKFSLAPIHRIGRHFLQIDTKIFYYLLKESKLLPAGVTESQYRQNKETYFQRVFRYERLHRGQFSFCVQTDGVSLAFHFHIPKPHPVEESSVPDRTIAIDPGRSNLIFGVEQLPDGRVQTYRLTRKHYYTASGMNRRKAKTAAWEQRIHAEELTHGRVSPRTANSKQWDQFLENLLSVYTVLWEEKAGKKWARERFRVYGLRRKVLDRFLHRMVGKVKPLILYGAAEFSSTARNELSAPTSALSRHCARFAPLRLVDEYNTTKVCARCDCVLSAVARQLDDGTIQEIRGLRRCSSNVCSQASFVDRDKNAALNILRCGLVEERPTALIRGTRNPAPTRWVLRKPESRKPQQASIPEETVSVT